MPGETLSGTSMLEDLSENVACSETILLLCLSGNSNITKKVQKITSMTHTYSETCALTHQNIQQQQKAEREGERKNSTLYFSPPKRRK
jgi:hypothetical protein